MTREFTGATGPLGLGLGPQAAPNGLWYLARTQTYTVRANEGDFTSGGSSRFREGREFRTERQFAGQN